MDGAQNSRSNARRNGRNRSNRQSAGGVTKQQNQPQAKPAKAPSGPSIILIHGWPVDVTEDDIEKYLRSLKIPFQSVALSKSKNVSLGYCTVIFPKVENALKMHTALKGACVDKKDPLVVTLTGEALAIHEAREKNGLGNRVSMASANATTDSKKGNKGKTTAQPKKHQPVSAASDKKKSKHAERKKKEKPQTVEDLDRDMRDYFGATEAAPAQSDQMVE